MPSRSDELPREVEREWFGLYAIIACVGNAAGAILVGWWLVVPLVGLLIWQVARVVRVTRKYEPS